LLIWHLNEGYERERASYNQKTYGLFVLRWINYPGARLWKHKRVEKHVMAECRMQSTEHCPSERQFARSRIENHDIMSTQSNNKHTVETTITTASSIHTHKTHFSLQPRNIFLPAKRQTLITLVLFQRWLESYFNNCN
jgi:hypothetical protein